MLVFRFLFLSCNLINKSHIQILIVICVYWVKVMLDACSVVRCSPWEGEGRSMYGMFFFLMCLWVVLSCSVFAQKTYKPKKT